MGRRDAVIAGVVKSRRSETSPRVKRRHVEAQSDVGQRTLGTSGQQLSSGQNEEEEECIGVHRENRYQKTCRSMTRVSTGRLLLVNYVW